MSLSPTLAPDAALVLGIASTAIPFARTPEEEAERWLRVLRAHGEAGRVLRALGVSEGPAPARNGHEQADSPRAGGGESQRPAVSAQRLAGAAQADVIELVGTVAARLAEQRGDLLGTSELLLAVIEVYGEAFERTLNAHGTGSREVLERVASLD
jgi:hypothetical protein